MKNQSIYLLLTVSVLMSSCGSDKGQNAAPGQETKTAEKTNPQDQAPGVSTSYYVDKEDDLKPCVKDTLGFLAYVKQSQQFKACLSEGWTAVQVQGKDGSNGKDGVSGKDGAVVAANDNTWKDPVTGKLWLVGGVGGIDIPYTTGCPSGYTLPTKEVAKEAVVNGFMNAVRSLNSQILAVYAVRPVYTAADVGFVFGLTVNNIANYNTNALTYVLPTGFSSTKHAVADSATIPSFIAMVCYK